jgi:hypothetical protein
MRNLFCTLSRDTLAILLFADITATNAQEAEDRPVVVNAEAEELPSAYGAPPDLSHGRISTLTKSYVLSPFSFELEAGYEGDIFRHGLPAHLFRQEIEMGLPARFTVGVQTKSSISREALATAALLSKRVTHWRIGTSSRSILEFRLNIVSASAMDCPIRANSLS